MGFELERVLHEAEGVLIRSLRSGSAREARKRRAQRKIQEFLRRLRRSGLLLVGLLAALVIASIVIGPIGFLTWLVAIPTIFMIAFMALFWPARREEPVTLAKPTARLDELAVRAADGLVDRWEELPPRALPAADAIVARLNELARHLGTLETNPVLDGEARRLICRHLPRLVDTYLELPASQRSSRSESSAHFGESLGQIAEELDHLLEQCCRDRQLSFETQRRFIQTRYGEDRRLKGE